MGEVERGRPGPAEDRRDPGGMAAAIAGLADQIETGWPGARRRCRGRLARAGALRRRRRPSRAA